MIAAQSKLSKNKEKKKKNMFKIKKIKPPGKKNKKKN